MEYTLTEVVEILSREGENRVFEVVGQEFLTMERRDSGRVGCTHTGHGRLMDYLNPNWVFREKIDRYSFFELLEELDKLSHFTEVRLDTKGIEGLSGVEMVLSATDFLVMLKELGARLKWRDLGRILKQRRWSINARNYKWEG